MISVTTLLIKSFAVIIGLVAAIFSILKYLNKIKKKNIRVFSIITIILALIIGTFFLTYPEITNILKKEFIINGKKLQTSFNPKLESISNNFNVANSVYVSDSFVYIADGSDGTKILEIKNKNNPQIIGKVDNVQFLQGRAKDGFFNQESADDIFVKGNYAYVADGQSGIQILDITNKTKPFMVGNYWSIDSPSTIFVEDNYCYITLDIHNIFQIIDISKKENPVIIGKCNIEEGSAQDIYIDGNFAYIANGCCGLVIVDISNKQNPKIISKLILNESEEGWASGIFVKDSFAYIADGEKGLYIINVSSKDNPVIFSSCKTMDSTLDVFVEEDFAYVADGKSGLQIIDVLNKKNPKINTTFYTSYYAKKIFNYENTAYIVGGDGNLQILSLNKN